ncbi:hypothetical protein [Streptomyces ossamyceticus]|uniref:hypothetical protein n=1 Tax=Streptomyces ossamyceticus TaxID=249581 RepID=UPI0034279E52
MGAALLPLETTESCDIAAEPPKPPELPQLPKPPEPPKPPELPQLPKPPELPELPALLSALTEHLGPVTRVGREDVSPADPSPPHAVPVPRRRLPELHGVSGRLQP